MASRTRILLTGVTGYIGGSVLARFINRPEYPSYDITVLVRSAEKAEKLKKLGINTVIGAHDDEELMASLAADADIIVATADADNINAAKATLIGLKKRYAATGVAPIYIHTSGTGSFVDDALGDRTTDVVYDDANPEQIESIPDTAYHRNVDLLLVNADKEGYVKTYIIMPSSIYGTASGPLVDQGIQNPHTIINTYAARAALLRGRSGVVGQGTNTWNTVHIDDVADLYIVLLKAIKDDPTTGHGREGFYIAENGEHSFYEVAQAIGEALVALGKVDIAEPSTFSQEESEKYFGGFWRVFGSNSRAKGNRSRSIGWRPVHPREDVSALMKSEVEALLKAGRLQ